MARKKPKWIMVCGPYGSGTRTVASRRRNLEKLNRVALKLHMRGYVPIIGVNNALPLIALAGGKSFKTIMMPLSLALAERCDACLRIGGASKGADREVSLFRKLGKPVYKSLRDIA
jgi:hypothetical protein